MEKKKCWCYVTYAFVTDEAPPLPTVPPAAELPTQNPPRGFEPQWFLNAKFPEDEE